MRLQNLTVLGRAKVPVAALAVSLALSGATSASAAIVWSSKAPMLTASGALAAATGRDGTVYAIGGSNGPTLRTNQPYDPVNNAWRSLAPMPIARHGLAAARLGKKIYAVGGFQGANNVPVGTLQVYNPTTNQWRTKAPMPTPRGDLMAVAGSDGKLYAIGGTNEDFQALCGVLAYNPVTNAWASAAPMPTARSLLAATASGLTVYAIGGVSDTDVRLSAVEAF